MLQNHSCLCERVGLAYPVQSCGLSSSAPEKQNPDGNPLPASIYENLLRINHHGAGRYKACRNHTVTIQFAQPAQSLDQPKTPRRYLRISAEPPKRPIRDIQSFHPPHKRRLKPTHKKKMEEAINAAVCVKIGV